MKTFQTYYFEADKTYQFRIKLAGLEPKGEALDRITKAIDVYQVETVSKSKRTPISERPEFPRHGPIDTYEVEVDLKYPATAEGVKNLLVNRAFISAHDVVVARCGEDYDILSETEVSDEEDDKGKQETVGQKRVDSMLKDFVKDSTKFDEIAKEK